MTKLMDIPEVKSVVESYDNLSSRAIIRDKFRTVNRLLEKGDRGRAYSLLDKFNRDFRWGLDIDWNPSDDQFN